MAVLDLPDPMQTPPTVKTGATDDLLSQLAGDEIDRLLAEADVEAEDDASRPSTEYIAPAPNFETTLDPSEAARITPPAELAAPVEPPQVPSPSQLADAPTPRDAAAEPSVTDHSSNGSAAKVAPAEMGALLDTLATTSTRMPPPAASPAILSGTTPTTSGHSSGADATGSALSAPPDSAAIIAAELETSDAERRALNGGALAAPLATDPGIDADAFDVDPSLEGAQTSAMPFFLRPLEWLNAPFAQSDERTRESIGKIALLTLMNAVGVLIYVFFFRRR